MRKSILDIPCASSQEAMLVAVGCCYEEKGNYCEAGRPVFCDACPSREDGVKRAQKRIAKEQQETIKEIALNDAEERRARVRDDGCYFQFEIGRRSADNPDNFRVERQFTIIYSEIDAIRDLLNSFLDTGIIQTVKQ